MKLRILQWGNSLGLRIPKIFAMHLGIEANREVEVELLDEKIIISPKKTNTLDALLQKVTPENKHGETQTGDPIGLEEW